MVIARRKAVRSTVLRYNTSVNVVVPGACWLTTVARATADSHVLGARVHVFSRNEDLLIVNNALTVRHGLRGTKSPAASAVALVANLLNRLAVGPLSAGIESVRSSLHFLLRESLERKVVKCGQVKRGKSLNLSSV